MPSFAGVAVLLGLLASATAQSIRLQGDSPPLCTLDTQVELSSTGGLFTWMAVGTCSANLTYIGSVNGLAGTVEPPLTLSLRGLPAGFYLTKLQGYSNGRPVEGLNDSLTVYYFGDEGVTADLSANGQNYIFTWTAVDGVTYFVSSNNETEVEAAPPFSTPVVGFQSLVVRVYLGRQLVGNAEGVVLFKLFLEKNRYDVFEDDGNAIVRVMASRPAPKNTIVTIELFDDSAVSGMDYLQAGRLSTVLLERNIQVEFSITIINDGIPELREERFNVALLARGDYEVAGPNETAVYIEDDDDLAISVAVALSATGTDMTFAWKQLEGVTYQCSINGQPAENCSPGFTVLGTSLSQTGNVLVITLFMDGQPVGQQSFMPPPIDPEPVPSLNPDDSATITWGALGGLTYQCSVDDSPPVACQPGYLIPEEKLPLANHMLKVTAFVGAEQVGFGEVNVPTCKLTAISSLIRGYHWASGFVRFRWSNFGNVASTGCRLDGGEEVECESGVQYNLNNISAGRHTVEVVAYCRANGERISYEQKNFKSRSGLPSDPDNCQRMSIQNAVAEYNSTAEIISISFDTSTTSTCVCRASALGKKKTGCESDHMFSGAPLSIFSGRRHRARVTVICRSTDCGVAHMVLVPFNLPN